MAPKRHLKAIYLDDDAGQAHLLARHLAKLESMDVDLSHYSRPEKALVKLLAREADLLFLDHHLGAGKTGLDVLKYLREAGFEGPIIMVTNREDVALVAEFLRHGADAYVPKGDLNQVSTAIQVALVTPHKKKPRILNDGS